MSIQILIPTPLRAYADRQASVETTASTVAGALNQLLAAHPTLHRHLFDAHGRLRNFVNLYVNDEDIRQLGGMETPVREGDTLTLVPSVAGGSV